MNWKHGYSGYANHGCRCEVCSRGMKDFRRKLKAALPEGVRHGHSVYKNYGCRCEACCQGRRSWELTHIAKDPERARAKAVANTRKWRLAHHAEERARARARQKTPAGLNKARRNNESRRARKLGQFIEDVDPMTVWTMHGGCCGICKDFVPADDFHVDHVVPLSRGGMHGYVNVQPAHPHCNLSKWAN